MYWPIGTPKTYASSTSVSSTPIYHLDDNSPAPLVASIHESPTIHVGDIDSSAQRLPADNAEPKTPMSPAVLSAEHDENDGTPPRYPPNLRDEVGDPAARMKEPILALKVCRTGHMFVVATATTMTVWQTKPAVILAAVIRSDTSLETYGENSDLLLRPDSAIFVVRTARGYLITYSIATDPNTRVYNSHFTNHHNVQRRRQSHAGGPGGRAPDQFLWGAGEGLGVQDTSVRFRMVIKVDAGIESALALDDELVVATQRPASIQCIQWSPDTAGKQTRTELLSRMAWLDKKSTVSQMTHDRPMNLMTWVTADGRAYAVQRLSNPGSAMSYSDPEAKRLFRGYCFYEPESPDVHAIQAVVNARFSLIAVGCADSVVRVYSVKDYAGNIPLSHTHTVPVSNAATGGLSVLTYSTDGYCLFAGYREGWATWSVYGKTGSHSFSGHETVAAHGGDDWLVGVNSASWIGGSSEILLTNSQNDGIWALEMARSALSTCYTSSNAFRTVLQTSTSISVYRGYDLPDLTSISTEPFLWHSNKIPPTYLLNQWPIRCTVISPDGRYVAVAGRRGLAHYSVNSGRWKTFADPEMENEFQVKGGMCWYRHLLVAAVEANRSHELRLYSRESALEKSKVLHTQHIPAPIVLVTSAGEDSVLVYTHDNLLYHFMFVSIGNMVRLTQVGQIAFHGIVRSPARVRGLSWILPEQQLAEGDPSQDVTVASVLFLVDGKLVMLRPSMSGDGHLKYDMRVIAQNVEFHASMRDEPFSKPAQYQHLDNQPAVVAEASLINSLWAFDGNGMKVWPEIQEVLFAVSAGYTRALPSAVYIPTDFYPLSMLLDKAIVLGVESDLVQRRDVSFSYFRFSIRTHLFLSDILRFYLAQDLRPEALRLAQRYQGLEYFSHALEVLLHHVLDDESDESPSPEDAILPRVLSLLSSFKEYLDIVLQCTRKTEVRQWKTLFAYLPPVQELFEESLQRGSLKTAGGYLIILHTLEETESVLEQSVRLFSRAIKEEDWDLCKELARFLAALDETGGVLKGAMEVVNSSLVKQGASGGDVLTGLHLSIPSPNGVGGGGGG